MKRNLCCVAIAALALTWIAPAAWAWEAEKTDCVTVSELVNLPQRTDMIVIAPAGRYKTAKVTVCDPNEPNGQGTSVTCQDYYKTTASYACPNGGNPSSPSCSVKGACNIPPPGSGTGTKCECHHWCVTSTEPEPTDQEPI